MRNILVGAVSLFLTFLAFGQVNSKPPESKRPEWLNRGLVFVGNWEPLQWVYRKNWQNWGNARSGAAAEAIHREEHTEATVVGLKNLGVNMVLTSFHKGFGIKNEKFNMDEAREYGKLLHKHGMKLGVYVSALLLYEELYAEFPESKNWNRVLYDGKPDVYGNDGYRYRAFLNHPEYINYMKRVCELAVRYGADLIHFDTISQTPENFHPLAEQMFRDWLKKRYPTSQGWFFRTGLHYRDYVKVPHYSDPLAVDAFDQPIMQEYLRFKSELLSDYAAEMGAFIHSLNPECAVEFNPQGITGQNRVLLSNVDHESLLPKLDAYWSEEPNVASYTKDGRLISKIRSMKVGQQYNSVMFSYTAHPPVGERQAENSDPRLLMAESMAFNRQCLGDIGTPLDYKSFPQTGRRYIAYFWKHPDLFARGETAADVAVLRSFASMAYNNYTTHRETMLAEQTLIQSQIPFDIIEDHNLADLGKYKVVILADQENLSDEQLSSLRQYIRNGGGVVATVNTGRFDTWRRDRAVSGLDALLGTSRSAGEQAPDQQTFGSGRAAYLRALVPSIRVPARTAFVNRYWAPAKNAQEFLKAIRWCANGKLNWELKAPPFVVANAYHQADKGRYLLHVLNYNFERQPAVNDIKITVRVAGAETVKQVTAYSPDEQAPATLQPVRTTDGLSVTLPRLGVYTIVVIQK